MIHESAPRILVVEDEAETAQLLKQLLELKTSARVESAGSLAEARALISSSEYDLVTVDHRLPDGLGMDLLAEITSDEQHPPVIVVTGQGDEELASLAVRKGAAGYIVKNERLAATLPEAVDKALRDFVLMKAVEAVRESEGFYRSLFDESADALFIETTEAVIEDVNRAAEKMFGFARDERIGRSAMALVPPDRRVECADASAALREGRTLGFENVDREGRLFPVEITASEVLTRRGIRYVVAVKDVSERMRAQKALEDERAFKEHALDAITDLFVIADLNGSFYKWNASFREVTGYSEEEIDAMRAFEFVSPEDFMQLTGAVEAVSQTGAAQKLELSVIAKDGRSTPYEVTASLIRDASGTPIGIAAVGRDISERRRSEEALRNVIKETNERREEITALLESTRLVLEHKDFRKAVGEIFELCLKLVGADLGFVALLGADPGQESVLFVQPEDLRPAFEAETKMPLRQLVTPSFTSGRASYENDFPHSRWATIMPVEHVPIENILIAPLVVEGEPAGMLVFANRQGGFTGRDALMAAAFGEVASVAYRDGLAMQMLQSSEARFRSVAETALEGVICADSRVEVTFWNEGARNIFGHTPGEMLGRPLTSILPERDREARLQSLLREIVGEASARGRIFEMTGLRKDGEEFPMELSRSAWNSETGENNYAVIVRDVTDRKRAEAALRSSEKLYRTLLHTSPDAVTVFDMDSRIIDVSQRTVEVYGYSNASELTGMSAIEFVTPTDVETAAGAIEKVLDGGVVSNLELGLLRGDGTSFVGEASASMIPDEEGNPKGYIVITRDVTERRKAEHEMQVLNNELEGYAHVVSHDLKGPLASMMTAGLALRSVLKGENGLRSAREAMQLVEIMESNINKSTALIDDLLELAEAGQKPYEVSAVDISSVVARVVSEREASIKSRRLKVHAEADLGRVVASETHMYQLFSNLITNAVKHNDSRKPEVWLSYGGRDEAGLHRYLVRDNGSGIDPDDLDRVFLPFFTGVMGETGIGLATVQKIVNVYGGEVRAYNEGGACFEFTLRDYQPL